MSRQTRMTETLSRAFAPLFLDVQDDSDRHAGHLGGPGHAGQDGETHFNVTIVADCFTGMNRVARTRAVNDALASEFAGGLHALSLTLRAPAEVAGSAGA